MHLWLDDIRKPPVPGMTGPAEGWVWCRSVDESIVAITSCAPGSFLYASLDHDLGAFSGHGGDGAYLTDWMAAHEMFPTEGIDIHSMNPVGTRTMLATIDRYAPYTRMNGRQRLR